MSMFNFLFTKGPGLPDPICGHKQLLPNIVDGLARTRPSGTFARMPRDARGWQYGVKKITFQELANAVNGMAHWLIEMLGEVEHTESLSVAYFGLFDARYQILALAAIKTGYKGVTGLVQIFDTVKCSQVVTASRSIPILADLEKKAADIQILDAPELDHLLEIPHPHFEYAKTFEEARNDAFMVLHTSGSTGSPKPITYTNDWVAAWLAHNSAFPPAGFDTVERHYRDVDLFSFGPPAHVGGLLSMLLAPICLQMANTYPLPTAGFTLSTLIETLRHCPVDFLITPPIFLDHIARDAELLAFLKTRTRMIGYGGGPLSKRTGDVLSKEFMLFTMFGTSENGVQTKMIPPGGWRPEYWSIMNAPPHSSVDMRLLDGSKTLYEFVVTRDADPEKEAPVFKMFPHLQEWSTGDVFTARDVTIPATEVETVKTTPILQSEAAAVTTRLYSFSHRLTDTITLVLPDEGVMVNTKAVNPLKFEEALSCSNIIEAVVTFGNRRPFLGLLVEVAAREQSERTTTASISTATEGDGSLLDQVWEEMLKHQMEDDDIRVEKRHIILTEPERPLPRASKGTVQRVPAISLYEDEINELYRIESMAR